MHYHGIHVTISNDCSGVTSVAASGESNLDCLTLVTVSLALGSIYCFMVAAENSNHN